MKFAVCASLVENAVLDAEYFLNVLLPFTQDNALMVVVDNRGVALDWYDELAQLDTSNLVATWLRFLTHTPNRNIEKVDVAVTQNGETFFRIANAIASEKNLLVWSLEPWTAQGAQFPKVSVLDRNIAKKVVSKSTKGQKVKSKDRKSAGAIKVKATGGSNVNVAQGSEVGGSQAAGTKTYAYAERGALVAQVDSLVANQSEAATAWNSFKEELSKPKPQKGILEAAWQKVVSIIPTAATFAVNVAAIIASIAPK